MEYFRLLLCSFLYVALVQLGIYASNDVPWGSYWKTALPKSPIPKTLQELLHPENWKVGKNAYTGISKDALNIINTRPDGNIRWGPPPADSGKIKADPNVTAYFLEKDLHLGKKMTLHFSKTTNPVAAPLLPRKVANSIPFSKSKLPQILNSYGVKPNSVEAQVIKQTIEECEAPGIRGEDKYCATSLESLVDFTVSRLGKYVQVYSTEVQNETKQEFRIAKGVVQKIGDRTYVVPLVGADGTKAEAVAVCHTDTSEWNKEHLAFQVLKIKPGTLPVCHFLKTGNLVWVPNK